MINKKSQSKDNSAKSQCQQILHHLKTAGSLNTQEARHKLDIMHSVMRLSELRKAGNDIQTVWIHAITSEGGQYRIGQYVLAPNKQMTIMDLIGVDDKGEN